MTCARIRPGGALRGALAAVALTALFVAPARAFFPPTLLEVPPVEIPPPPPIEVPPVPVVLPALAPPPPITMSVNPGTSGNAPEPAALLTGLVGTGLAGLFGLWRRRKAVGT